MASELYNVIDALSREKGIDPQIVVSAVEDAIVVATRKYYKTQENLRAELDKETGKIRAYAVKKIVETPNRSKIRSLKSRWKMRSKINPDAEVGGELQIDKPTDVLGRIAAQLAKQVIFQKVREAERDTVYNEYIGRVGEIVNATVKRHEGPDVIFDIGKAEARMPRKEQSRLESFAIGERVRVVIARVEKASKGPQVIVSRAAPELVPHLFQTEVPEIYDNTVVIRAIAREAGERTKIAVMSKDKDVDRGGRLRRHEGHARAVDHPRTARREDRHHRVSRRFGHLCRKGIAACEGEPRHRGRCRGEAPGSDRRRQPAVAGHRQEGPERPAGGEAAGLEDRHQERGREAPGSRAADVARWWARHPLRWRRSWSGRRAGRRSCARLVSRRWKRWPI